MKTVNQENRSLSLTEKFIVGTGLVLSSGFAMAEAGTPTAPDTAQIVQYAGLIIVAVGVVGAAILMVPLAAKGFKWIKSAF